MIFRFVVKHCRWLAHVPLAPQVFDAGLLTWTILTNRERFRAMQELEAQILRLSGVRLRPHRLGGTGFALGRKEFAHMHGNGLVDVHLSRSTAASLIKEMHAEPHHIMGHSAWVSYWVHSRQDIEKVRVIIEQAHSLASSQVEMAGTA